MSGTMKAVVWEGKPYHMSVEDVPLPQVEDTRDVIVRITSAGICGSDLHTYHGYFGNPNPPWTMGHEAVGLVTQTGTGVHTVKVGDRVMVMCILACGYCANCTVDKQSHCLVVNPPEDVAIYGFGPELGKDLGGCQAEFVRVPFADKNCVILPPGKDHELDFLVLADIWPTSWDCLDAAGFQAGDSVAVFGAGPMGLLCAYVASKLYSAILRGASVVYSIDHVAARLEKARSIGANPINFQLEDPVARILKDRPLGVERSCDCVGFEAVKSFLKPQENIVISNCINVTAPGGGIGAMGVYPPPSSGDTAGAPRASAPNAKAEFVIPFGTFWFKGLSMRGGPAEIHRLWPRLRDLIVSGKAQPGFVFSSEIRITEAPHAYKRFSLHKETKVVIRFPDATDMETDGPEENRNTQPQAQAPNGSLAIGRRSLAGLRI